MPLHFSHAAAFVCCVISPYGIVADHRPNVVFIITDDQLWDTLECTGHPVLKAPNIDCIADEGISFNNFFVCTPLCSPSRASFLTGIYPHRHKVINNDKLGIDIISHTLMTFTVRISTPAWNAGFAA